MRGEALCQVGKKRAPAFSFWKIEEPLDIELKQVYTIPHNTIVQSTTERLERKNNMPNDLDKVKDLLPLAPITYVILFALVGEELHGYEIMKRVDEEMGKKVPTATVYRNIQQMLRDGLIEEATKRTEASGDPRRRYYKVTPFGQTAYNAETRRFRAMLASDKSNELASWDIPSMSSVHFRIQEAT